MTTDSSAARAADVTIEEVSTPGELDVLRELMRDVWGPEVVPPRNVLRGLALVGSSLLVARRDQRPVGFAIGWVGWAGGIHFHSHQTGVLPDLRSSGIGFALKMAQRDSCRQHGIDEMRWTYDPLLAANAAFNLCRLGARPIAFLPNCYGARVDVFNTGDTTDRLEVSWQLSAPPTAAPDAVVACGPSLVSESPEPHRSAVEPVPGAALPIPPRYHQLRESDPVVAAAWRTAVASALADTFAAGLGIVGFRDNGYLIGVG